MSDSLSGGGECDVNVERALTEYQGNGRRPAAMRPRPDDASNALRSKPTDPVQAGHQRALQVAVVDPGPSCAGEVARSIPTCDLNVTSDRRATPVVR